MAWLLAFAREDLAALRITQRRRVEREVSAFVASSGIVEIGSAQRRNLEACQRWLRAGLANLGRDEKNEGGRHVWSFGVRSRVEVLLVREDGRVLVGASTRDRLDGSFALAVFDVLRAARWRAGVCANASCGRLVIRTHGAQAYCGPTCGQTARQRRYRVRLRARARRRVVSVRRRR
jgi:hypothetical protein